MRILFMGTPDFAVASLKRLVEDGHELCGVFTQPDKPKNRGHKLTPSPVKEYALSQGLEVYQPLKMRDGKAFSIVEKLAPELIAMAQRVHLTVEMGRFFVSACGTYLTTVVDTKVNCGHAYAIADGGIHHVNYLGGNMGMRVPRIEHLRCDIARDTDVRDWTLCGSLCTTADVLVRKAAFDGLTPGDVLAFRYIGAYSVTEGPALFLSRDMPRIVLHGASGDRLARDTVHASDLNCPHI